MTHELSLLTGPSLSGLVRIQLFIFYSPEYHFSSTKDFANHSFSFVVCQMWLLSQCDKTLSATLRCPLQWRFYHGLFFLCFFENKWAINKSQSSGEQVLLLNRHTGECADCETEHSRCKQSTHSTIITGWRLFMYVSGLSIYCRGNVRGSEALGSWFCENEIHLKEGRDYVFYLCLHGKLLAVLAFAHEPMPNMKSSGLFRHCDLPVHWACLI